MKRNKAMNVWGPFTFLLIAMLSFILCGCASSTAENENSVNQSKEIQLTDGDLRLGETKIINISGLSNSAMVFHEDNKEGYALVGFKGRINQEELGFKPKEIAVHGEDIFLGLSNEEEARGDTESLQKITVFMEKSLGEAYQFEEGNYAFQLVIKIETSDEESKGLIDNSAKYTGALENDAKDLLDGTVLTVFDDEGNSIEYTLIRR